MANKFTIINKADEVLIGWDNGAVKTFPKNAYQLNLGVDADGDPDEIYLEGVGSPTRIKICDHPGSCRAIVDEVNTLTPAVGSSLLDFYHQIRAFFFRKLTGTTYTDKAYSSVINLDGNYMMEASAGNIVLTDGGLNSNDKTIILYIAQETNRTFVYPISWVLKSSSDSYDNTLDNIVVITRIFDITYIDIINTPVAS